MQLTTLIGVVLTAATAAGPRLAAIHPAGAQRGSKLAVELRGAGLAGEVELLSKIPGVLKLTGKAEPKRRSCELVVNPDAAVGLYPVRVRTAAGVSNYVLFSVGIYPDVAEKEPNNELSAGQPVESGRTINGSLTGQDRDVYRIQARAGERWVAEIEAKRLGSSVDPVIEVLTPEGRHIARKDDSQGLGGDCRVDVTFAAAGEYLLVVHDVTYKGQGSYRLKLGDYQYAGGIFPLGGARGSKVQATLWGGSLNAPVPIALDASKVSGDCVNVVHPQSVSAALPLRFLVGEGPEFLEDGSGKQKLTNGAAVNGRISAPREVDRYGLSVSPGQTWRFSLTAAAAGSHLDSLLTVYDSQNRALASADDGAGLDAAVTFTIPAGVKELVLAVEDLHRRGGNEFPYRLHAQLVQPDFALDVVPQSVNIPRNGLELVQVRVNRQGYNGPIQLYIPETLKGIEAQGGAIPPGANEGYLLLSASSDAPLAMAKLEIWGRGGSAAKPFTRRAGGGVNNPYVMAGMMDDLPAAVTQERGFTMTAAPPIVRIVHGQPASLKLVAQRGPKADQPITITSVVQPPDGRLQPTLTIPKDKSEGQLGFPSDPEVPLGRRQLFLTAKTTVEGVEVAATLPPMTLEVVKPFALELLSRNVPLQPGGTGTIEAVVRRQPPFDQEVAVRVEDLPKGLTASETIVKKGSQLALVTLTGSNVAPGTYTINVRLAAEMDGRKRTKDYVIAPQPVTVQVAPAPPAPVAAADAAQKPKAN